MAGLRNKLIWPEPIDIIFQGKFGILPIAVINRRQEAGEGRRETGGRKTGDERQEIRNG